MVWVVRHVSAGKLVHWLVGCDSPTFAGDQECVSPGRLVVFKNTDLGFARKALVLQQLRDCYVVW
jgi:hypothetical protein